jgi:hypothetical protein
VCLQKGEKKDLERGDTYNVTLVSGSNSFRNASNLEALDGDSDGVAGGNYMTTFKLNTASSDTVTLSLPDFVRGYGQAVNVPATGTGIPLTISTGRNVSGVDLTLIHDESLLSVTGFTVNPALAALGVQAVFNSGSTGSKSLSIFGTDQFSAVDGSLVLGYFAASVPATAPYAGKQVLSLTNLAVFDATANVAERPSIADDAVHIAAYFGDASGNRLIQANDAVLTARKAAGVSSGLSAYQLADPVLTIDISGNDRVQSNDASLIARRAAGITVTQIPTTPTGLAVPPTGLDPILALGNAAGLKGQTIAVPVTVEVPVGESPQAFSGFDLAIAFDPSKLTFVSIAASSFTTGFSVSSNNANAGIITISGFTSGQTATIDSSSGVKLLANITFSINASAADGPTVVNLLNHYASAQYTALFDSKGSGLVLTPAPTNSSYDAVDSVLTIQSPNTAPTDIALSGSSVTPTSLSGGLIGTLSTRDADAGNRFTYSLVAGSGDTDNAAFALVGNQLRTMPGFIFGAKSRYSVRIRSTDQGGLSVEKLFTITSSVRTPVVSVQPGNTTVSAGVPAIFAAFASGTPAPMVQWQVSTNLGGSWSNIPGATGSRYTTSATILDYSGNLYRAVFTSTIGSVTSKPATLKINSLNVTPSAIVPIVVSGVHAPMALAVTGQPSGLYRPSTVRFRQSNWARRYSL